MGDLFHLGGAERAERSLHRDIDKLGIGEGLSEEGLPRTWGMDFDSVHAGAVRRAASEGAIQRREANPLWFPPQIEILDIRDRTAVVKMHAFWGDDYLLIGRFGEEWKVRQVLWQTRPKVD